MMAEKVARKRPTKREKDAAAKRAADVERLSRRPSDCRMYVRKTLAGAFPDMVDGFIEVAKTGSLPHLKLATELVENPRKREYAKKSSAARLLEEL